MGKLDGKVALITGASRGIGAACARLLEQDGALLVLTARKNLEALNGFKSARVFQLELGSSISIDSLIKEVKSVFGRIDILVNNAAVFCQGEFEKITEDELNEFIAIDFKASFLLLQRVFTLMKNQGSGRIINLASGAGILGSSRAAHYAALKAALINLTKSLAKLGGAHNITANAVCPGFIETDMTKDMLEKRREDIEQLIPLSRIGEPLDVARLVRFLCLEDSAYITGQAICVDGGLCMV